MKRGKYLITFFIGTLAYVLLSITVGQNSIRCYNQLEEQKRVISKQVTELETINSELYLEVNALKYDKAVIAAYARKLDYVSDGEKLVKITGLKRAQPPLYDAGTVIKHTDPTFLSEKSCKIISFFLGLMTLVIIFFYDLSQGNISFHRKERTIVKGIPIYDLQQI